MNLANIIYIFALIVFGVLCQRVMCGSSEDVERDQQSDTLKPMLGGLIGLALQTLIADIGREIFVRKNKGQRYFEELHTWQEGMIALNSVIQMCHLLALILPNPKLRSLAITPGTEAANPVENPPTAPPRREAWA